MYIYIYTYIYIYKCIQRPFTDSLWLERHCAADTATHNCITHCNAQLHYTLQRTMRMCYASQRVLQTRHTYIKCLRTAGKCEYLF